MSLFGTELYSTTGTVKEMRVGAGSGPSF